MSVVIGNRVWASEIETRIKCPICEQISNVMSKAIESPLIETNCMFCKGKITILLPELGGELECWETNCPESIERLTTNTKNKVYFLE